MTRKCVLGLNRLQHFSDTLLDFFGAFRYTDSSWNRRALFVHYTHVRRSTYEEAICAHYNRMCDDGAGSDELQQQTVGPGTKAT